MKGFDLITPKNDETGKSVESLQKSRKIRENFINRYGYIPTSILINDRHSTQKVLDLARDSNRRYSDCKNEVNRKIDSFNLSARGVRHKQALSTFPQNIGRIIIDFYCPENGVVYDPFAGHNSRMQLVYESQRDYVGVDISKEFMKANRKIKKAILDLNKKSLIKNKSKIKLIEGSLAIVNLPDDYADFTITSPPYWNLEYYGDEPGQLGKNKTYEAFLACLKGHIRENFRILKPKSYCAWFVNDFVKDGIFRSYHVDVIKLFEEIEFKTDNIYIIDLGVPITAAFVQSMLKIRRFPKRHEYCLMFFKP